MNLLFFWSCSLVLLNKSRILLNKSRILILHPHFSGPFGANGCTLCRALCHCKNDSVLAFNRYYGDIKMVIKMYLPRSNKTLAEFFKCYQFYDLAIPLCTSQFLISAYVFLLHYFLLTAQLNGLKW